METWMKKYVLFSPKNKRITYLCYSPTFTMLPTIIFGKNTAGTHKEPSKKYKNNLRTLTSKSYEQCRTKHEYYNNKAPQFLTAGLQTFPI